MIIQRNHVLSLIATAAAGLAISPRVAVSQPLQKLRCGILLGETSATVYYARELGMFGRAGLDVEITEVVGGAAAAAAVIGGSMDVGFADPTAIIIGHDRGLPFSILAPAAIARTDAQSNGLIIASKTSTIRSGKDLNGKIVGLNSLGGLPYLSARAWIDKHGGDSNSVHFLELRFSEMIEAVRSSRVEAAAINTGFDPLIGKPNDPVRLVGSSYDAVAPEFISSVWFSTSDWIAKNSDVAKRFIAVMKQAAVWANGHPHESAQMLAPHLKQTPQEIEATTRITYGLNVTPDLIQPLIELAAKYGSIKTHFSARNLISTLAM
jgi:NitT/TauT family transport system substrate-binding protein